MMTADAIVHDAEYYERVGFRAAWISLTQVPLVYLLSSKTSIIASIVGSSYERINWLHRWVSRTLLFSVTVHGAFFLREWIRADFLAFELAMMLMVKYGIGAWFILLWTLLSSLGPLRKLAYEFFILQHIAAATVFLWVLWVHVPKYSYYFVWYSVGAMTFDWIIRCGIVLHRNIHRGGIGYNAQLQEDGDSITIITLNDVPLSWKPGQHFRLWIPQVGLLENHPFTVATRAEPIRKDSRNKIQFVIHARSGFSKRINRHAEIAQQASKQPFLRAFVSGPYGSTPNWNAYETVILISASTGGSFTLPILEKVLAASNRTCVRQIRFLILARRRGHINYYIQRIPEAVSAAEALGIDLSVEIAVTKDSREAEGLLSAGGDPSSLQDDEKHMSMHGEGENPEAAFEEASGMIIDIGGQSTSSTVGSEHHGTNDNSTEYSANENRSKIYDLSISSIVYTSGRPSISDFIRIPVETSHGETLPSCSLWRQVLGSRSQKWRCKTIE